MQMILLRAISSANTGVSAGPPMTANGLMFSTMVTASACAATASSPGPGALELHELDLRP